MVNTRDKGNRILNKCIEEFYSKDKWNISKSEKSGKFIKEKDLFGLFDAVCILRGVGQVNLIQSTCNKPHSHKLYQDFSIENNLVVWQYVYHDKSDKAKGWIVYTYNFGIKYIKDYREKTKKLIKEQTKRKNKK